MTVTTLPVYGKNLYKNCTYFVRSLHGTEQGLFRVFSVTPRDKQGTVVNTIRLQAGLN